ELGHQAAVPLVEATALQQGGQDEVGVGPLLLDPAERVGGQAADGGAGGVARRAATPPGRAAVALPAWAAPAGAGGGGRCAHGPSRSPGPGRAPRHQSAAAWRARPSGCTSTSSSRPSPATTAPGATSDPGGSP